MINQFVTIDLTLSSSHSIANWDDANPNKEFQKYCEDISNICDHKVVENVMFLMEYRE